MVLVTRPIGPISIGWVGHGPRFNPKMLALLSLNFTRYATTIKLFSICYYDDMECLDMILQQYPMQTSTLSCLNAAQLARVARTSKGFHTIIDSFTQSAYNLDRFLLLFLPDPSSFRRIQFNTGAIISGSSVFRFFTRLQLSTVAMDVFVGSKFKYQVGEWLLSNNFVYRPATIESLEYKITQSSTYDEAIACPGFRTVRSIGVTDSLDFFCMVDGVERKLVLHVTRSCPIMTVLKFPFSEWFVDHMTSSNFFTCSLSYELHHI